MTMTFLEDGEYGIHLHVTTDDYNNSQIIANAKFYDSDDDLIAEYNAIATVRTSWETYWLEFSTATSEITEIAIP